MNIMCSNHLRTVSQCGHKQSINKPYLALSLPYFYYHLIFTARMFIFLFPHRKTQFSRLALRYDMYHRMHIHHLSDDL